MSTKVYSILTENILKLMKSGVAPWQRPWRKTGAPRSIAMKDGQSYRGVNYFTLSMISQMNGWTNVWLTFKMMTERGGKIKHGQEKNYVPVFYYKPTQRVNQVTGDMESGRPLLLYFLVYNLSQIDGVTVAGVNDGTEGASVQLSAPQSIVDGYQNAPETIFGGDSACYIPTVDRIRMPHGAAFDTVEHYYATMFHEMAHSTGHASRLNRKEVMDTIVFGSHDYSLEELTAELTSLFLCDECGIANERTTENTAAYLSSWHDKLSHDPKMFATAAARAQKAADHILGRKASYEKDVKEENTD